MAGQKISLLPPVSQVLPTDMFVISRGGNTYKIYGSYLAAASQFDSLSSVVATHSTKRELDTAITSFATATAAVDTKIDTIASTYTTTVYVNNEIDQARVYIDDKSRTFTNSLSDYVPSPIAPQTGNNITWDGSKWIAQTPPIPIVNNYMLDTASVGSLVWHGDTTPPVGYLVCDGSSISREIYSELFAVLGTKFGSADSGHFNLPDLRGNFIRGWDNGRGIDLGREFGSFQVDSLNTHDHGITTTVSTTVYTFVDTAVDTLVNTTASTQVTSNGDTDIVSTAVTLVTTDLSTNVVTTIENEGLTVNVDFPATESVPVPFLSAVAPGTGTFNLSTGTDYSFVEPMVIGGTISGVGTIEGLISPSSTATSLATSTALTLVTSTATTEISSSAITTATSLATSTAMSMATSTAVSLATSVAAPAGNANETRPRNTALLPCIKYTKMVATVGLNSVLSAYIPKPLSPTTGQYIGYNGSSWVAINGLPLTASLRQFLTWNGSAWVAGDYPSNLTTLYTTSFTNVQPTPSLSITNIPFTAKRITIVFSQVNMNGGAVVKIRLGTILGLSSSNYKGNSTAIGSVGQRYLTNNAEFNLFGSISYTSVVPNVIIPATQTITSQFMDATVTLTKNGTDSWVFANVGSLEGWTTSGGGSLTLPSRLDRISIFPNVGEFTDGTVTIHWE